MAPPGLRRRQAAIVAIVIALVGLAGFFFLVSVPARAAVFTLYGDAGRGWGPTPATINSPGPTLTVFQGEMVHIDLYSADLATHTWCIDYSGNNACEAGESESPQFFSMTVPVSHMFFATGPPGTYHYVCGIHGGLTMWGLFTINPAPPPVNPVVTVSAPAGGERWTGGTPHTIAWNMTDPDDSVTALRAWVNYTTGGPSTPIAGPIVGSTNPHSVTWSVPRLNATSVFVNVTVVDPAGTHGWAVTPAFLIDSKAPSVSGQTPPNGSSVISTTTNVIVTFNESMNRTATATPATATLQDTASLAWIPVTYSWSGGDTVLTMDPVPTLSPTTMYRASINVSATDASDPGNPLSQASAWSFTTASGADLTKPQISNVVRSPPVAEFPAPVGVTATLTDNDIVSSAYVNETRPDATLLNLTLPIDSGNTWGRAQVYATAPPSFLSMIGNYLFTVEAVDPSGNLNRSAQGTFTVRDTTPPAISYLAATPSPAEVYEPVNITVTVSDPFLVSVYLVANGTNSSMIPIPASSVWYVRFTPMTVQAYPLVVWPGDRRPNYGSLTGTVQAQDTKPPPVPMGLVATVIGASIQLTWMEISPPPDLAGFKLYRSTSVSGPFTTPIGPANITGTVYVDQTAQAGTRYYYAVTSLDSGGRESAHSNVASATVPAGLGVDLTPVIIGVVTLAIIATALTIVLLLRRRREQPPKT